MKDKQLAEILNYITALARDGKFFGSVTLRFQGSQGLVYIVTERGQKPEELYGR